MPKPDKQKLFDYIKAELAIAKAYDAEKESERIKAHKLLMGKELGTVKDGDPAVVSSDVSDAIEAIMPDLTEIFATTDEPISIKHRKIAAKEAAKTNASLIKYQTQRQMEWFKLIYTWVKDGLAYRNGLVQWGWDFRYRWDENEYDRLTNEDLEQIYWDGGSIINEGRPWYDDYGNLLGLLDCKVKERKILADKPSVKNIFPGSFLLSPWAGSIEEASFGAIRDYPPYYRLEEEGRTLGYDLSEVEAGLDEPDSEAAQRAAHRGLTDPQSMNVSDPKLGPCTRYVCYFQWRDEKGNSRPMTATIVNDKIVHSDINHYGRIPVISWSPIIDTHSFEGISITDLVSDFQHINTALWRSVLKVVKRHSDPQTLVKRYSGVNLNEILGGSGVTMVNDLNAVKEREAPQLGNDTWRFIEYMNGLKEERVGITRYNQGLDAKSLNHTARGITTIMNQAQKRIRLIARLFAENGLKPLFRNLIWLNQNFLDRELTFALSDEEDTTVNPGDLGGEFDLIVNVGLGTSDQQMTAQQGLQLLNILGGLGKSPAGQAMVNPGNLYQLLKTIIEAMGWNASPIITNPEKSMMEQGANGQQPLPANGTMQRQVGEGPEGSGVYGQPGLSGVYAGLHAGGERVPVEAIAGSEYAQYQ